MADTNTTISWPDSDWQMLWGNGGFKNFQLDIVGFLAVLGEGSVLANSQVSALSRLFYLPRILPAPQALLPPTRPRTLPSAPAAVCGVYSGNTKDRVHHVANILLGGELETFTVRCVEITKKRKGRSRTLTRMDTLFNTKENTMPLVTAKTNGPLSYVTCLGCFLSTVLFISSIVFGDGMSLVATLLLSFLSTLTGIANKWRLKLPQRGRDHAPPGDTVIRYPNGSYLVVRCEEEIARELYFAPEEIEYEISSPAIYRMISLLGTIILMLGIIALANAKLQLQFAWAGAYVIINAAHWVVAALPPRLHWDLDCYEINEQGVEGGPDNSSFTEALWKAILLTKDVRWVKNGSAAPQTGVWDDWLIEAEGQALRGGHRTGPLMKPHFVSGQKAQKATIWTAPEDWDPKVAWNRINNGEGGIFSSSHGAGKIHAAAPAVAGAPVVPSPTVPPPTMPAPTVHSP